MVAERVVHLLEPIEVDEEQRDRLLRPVDARERDLQPVEEQRPVRQARERVVQRAVRQDLGLPAQPEEVDEDLDLRAEDLRLVRPEEIVDGTGGVAARDLRPLGGAGEKDDRHVAERLVGLHASCGL